MKQWWITYQVWWQKISQREQYLVIAASVLLVLAGVYWGLIQPMTQASVQAQERHKTEQQLLVWVQEQAQEIHHLRAQHGQTMSDQPLNQVVSNSIRRFNIELIRLQPKNDSLQVWIQPVAFNALLAWIDFLQQQENVEVELMDLDASAISGKVEVKRLQLRRGEA